LDVQKEDNLFVPLINEARQVIRRAMHNSLNEKLAVSTAQDVLDRAGQTRKVESRVQYPIVITNSQVLLLARVAQEVENAIESDPDFPPET